MNTESVLDRGDFLEKNKADLALQMRVSGITDPVGVVADLRDFHGRQFALAVGMNEDVIDQRIERFRVEQMIPTVTAVITWKDAETIMPHTSPTASKTLAAAKALCNANGHKLVIAIMSKGNRYELVDLSGIAL